MGQRRATARAAAMLAAYQASAGKEEGVSAAAGALHAALPE